MQVEELEAAQLPRTLADVDYAVMNGNYALEAGFSVSKDALATEDANSEAAQTYANVLVVKEGNENNPGVQALLKALKSQEVKGLHQRDLRRRRGGPFLINTRSSVNRAAGKVQSIGNGRKNPFPIVE